MLVIENFLTLKLGEVWTEVANDLKSLGLQLMGADDNLITTLSMRLPNMAQYIQNSQIAILQEVHRKVARAVRLAEFERVKIAICAGNDPRAGHLFGA